MCSIWNGKKQGKNMIIWWKASTLQIGLAGKIRNNVVAGIGTDFFVVFWLRRCMCKSLA